MRWPTEPSSKSAVGYVASRANFAHLIEAPPLNRRMFCRSLVGASLATLGSVLAFPPLAHAVISPATVILIVNTALSVAQLFSGGGSVNDLLSLQVELLKHIESELAVIQQGILEILNRLDQIEQLIGKIPEQVVVELYRAKITALNGTYTEILNTYNADVKEKGINYARSQSQAELEDELLKPLREARDVLMTYSSFSLIPIICTASFVETHAMIMAGYRTTRMLQAMARYSNWMQLVRDGKDGQDSAGLTGAIASIENKRTKDRAAAIQSQHYECFSRVTFAATPGEAGNPCGAVPGIGIVGTYIPKHTNPELHPSSIADIDGALDQMIKDHILPENDRPLIIGLTFASDPPEQQFIRCNANVLRPAGRPANFPPKCDDVEAQLAAAMADPSRSFTETGLQLMSLCALKDSASKGLVFLDKLGKDLKAAPVS